MAESIDSVSCGGSKRDFPGSSPQEQQQYSDIVSAVSPREVSEESVDSGSFPKEVQEDVETSPKKKVKRSFLPISRKDQEVFSSDALNASASEIKSGYSERTSNNNIDESELLSGFVDEKLVQKKDDEREENSGSVEQNKVNCSFNAEHEGNQIGKSECLLEAEKKRLLAELENGTVFTNLETIPGFSSFYRIDKSNGDQEQRKPAEDVGIKNDCLYEGSAFIGRSLKCEVIDDTALIDMVPVENDGNGVAENQDIALSDKNGSGDKQVDGKQIKRSRRKGKGKEKNMKMIEVNTNLATQVIGFYNAGRKDNNQHKIVYTRQELEAMRFVSTADQKTFWRRIYGGLAPEVVNEYNKLASMKNHRKSGTKFDLRQPNSRMEQAQSILGENVENNMDYTKDNIDCVVEEEECVEADDSDDDYNTILKPAFAVDGQPDFDSGPPEDGFEYLRRVRWEAAQIPNVRVAKIDKGNYVKREQSVYMPQIPDIPKCPEHLLPLKEWEDAFLSDFSNLRLALSGLGASSMGNSCESESMFIANQDENISDDLLESVLVDKFNNLNTKNAGDVSTQESSLNPGFLDPKDNEESSVFDTNPEPKTVLVKEFNNLPTLSAIRGMDSVKRVSTLRKRIGSLEAMSDLSRNDALWIFALCAAMDTPLDADTCASLRGLLRKCACIRAAKSEVDDELVMANILVTITGKYFGQMEAEESVLV